jgi:hypothetical protein
MIQTNTEYFITPYYFYITEKSDKISLYYSIADTLVESRKKDEKIDFDKKDLEKVKKGISSILKNKKIKTKGQIKKYFEPISKEKSEIEELVDYDGTMNNSKYPPINWGLTQKNITDKIVPATRMPGNPVTRGYRRYYGESTSDETNVVNEVDYSEAFGYEETKDMDGKETFNYLVKKMGMEPDEAKERTEQFGKDPSGNRTKNAPKKIRNKKGFIDRMTLSEIQRQKMIKAIDEILLNRKNSDGELGEKEDKASKIIKKNVDSLKKMAEKEGLTINQLIKMLKSE